MYDNFIEKVTAQDSRNKFGTCEQLPNMGIPVTLASFYKHANPLDVEIVQADLTAIKFYSITELDQLQTEYDLSADAFVFATHEGDPIFLESEHVYTAIPQAHNWEYTLLAESFAKYLSVII